MTVYKKFAFLALLISFICFAGLALAQEGASAQVPNLIGATDFGQLLGDIVKAVGGIIAGIGTIMFIVSGIMFLFSAGSPQKINNAKTALIYAIIGMVVGLSASAIVGFIKQTVGN